MDLDRCRRYLLARIGLELALAVVIGCRPAAHDQDAARVEESFAEPRTPAPTVVPMETPLPARSGSWWDVPYPQPFDASRLGPPLERLRADGNRLVDPDGDTVILQGVNISDPDKLERGGHWHRRHFEVIREWGANVVRIPVHPVAWRGRGKDEYFELLDQAVVWATELGMYLIIDWHSIGNLATELFQHPMYQTSRAETYDFWRSIAFRYQGIPTVAFYELFNEPTVYNNNLGTLSWDEWKAINEQMITIIDSHDHEVIPLIAGFNWGYDLTSVARDPIDHDGVGYVSHPYPQKTTAPFEVHWDEAFGFVAGRYPLLATEIGYMAPDDPGAHVPVKDDGSYGPRITDYLAKKGASWTAWCFDPEWPPQLIRDWDYTPTEAGLHFRSVMQGRVPTK